jgi:hypothetical protein
VHQDLGPAGLVDDYRPHDITSFASAGVRN